MAKIDTSFPKLAGKNVVIGTEFPAAVFKGRLIPETSK